MSEPAGMAWAFGAEDVERGSDADKMAVLEARIITLKAKRGVLQDRPQTPVIQKQMAELGAELKAANVERNALETRNYSILFREVAKRLLSPDAFAEIQREVTRRQVELERGRRQKMVGEAVSVRGTAPGPKTRA
jgi:hypothetical protein